MATFRIVLQPAALPAIEAIPCCSPPWACTTSIVDRRLTRNTESESQNEGTCRDADLATGRRTLVHEIRPSDLAGVWIARDPLVTPDRRSYAYSYYQWLHSLYLADGLR